MKRIVILILLITGWFSAKAQYPQPSGLTPFVNSQFYYKVVNGDTLIYARSGRGYWFPILSKSSGGGGGGNTIYTANDSLISDRTVSLNLHSLDFRGNYTTDSLHTTIGSGGFTIDVVTNTDHVDNSIGVGGSGASMGSFNNINHNNVNIAAYSGLGAQAIMEVDSTSGSKIIQMGINSVAVAPGILVTDDIDNMGLTGATLFPKSGDPKQYVQYGNLNNPTTIQTTVNGSVSGSAVFSEPYQGNGDKKIIIYLNALNGTASYTFPVAFTHTPIVMASNGLATTKVTALSTTTLTVTGATDTGIIIIEGY